VSLTGNSAYEFAIVGAEIAMGSDLSEDGSLVFSVPSGLLGASPAGTQYIHQPDPSGFASRRRPRVRHADQYRTGRLDCGLAERQPGLVGAAAEIAMASFLSGDLANSILGNLLGSSPPKATKSPNFS
jgi:hypothetical protein